MMHNKIYSVVVVVFALLIAMTYGKSIETRDTKKPKCKEESFLTFHFTDDNITTNYYLDECHKEVRYCADKPWIKYSTDDAYGFLDGDDYARICEEAARLYRLENFAFRRLSKSWSTIMVVTLLTTLLSFIL